MHWIDWLIVLLPAAIVLGIAIRSVRYLRGVSDFLAGGRSAGRYLVANAYGEAGMGAITVVGLFEIYHQSGFVFGWWNTLYTLAMLLIALTGFCIYRYRETRAMTLAQFFEIRYSRRFRIFAGFLCAVSGILNYAIFPAVGARFFVYYCGFPHELHWAGLTIPTFIPVMACLMTFAASFTIIGGQLTAMITDCFEGLLSGAMYIVIVVTLLWLVPWTKISEVMSVAPAGQSLLNPYDSGAISDFNLWYVLINVFATVYSRLAWQGNQGFNCAAINPHEAKMGGILGNWREYSKKLLILIMAVCAYAYLRHPEFAGAASGVEHELKQISNPALQTQARVPIALSHLLPVGVKGMLCFIMLFALIACDSSYLHSWGSIVIQDVILPLRKSGAPVDPRQHMRLLRWSIVGVAVFAFLFSALFRQTDFIYMYFAITGAIFLGGAGSVIIGGLYWKRGTTAAAWTAMIAGSSLAVAGIVVRQINPRFPLNGQWLFAIAISCAIISYVIVSLLSKQPAYNMDKLLHRGAWAVQDDAAPSVQTRIPRWMAVLGIDEQFSRRDKLLSIGMFTWNMLWLVIFLVVTVWHVFFGAWPVSWWSQYWFYAGALIPLLVGIVTTIWFTVGGIGDIRALFRRLDARNAAKTPEPSASSERP
ncbi:MAG: sodium:proline symporter [Opitutae bacterium]|nr:sodium:proline symporter [Opitutae bacterium]